MSEPGGIIFTDGDLFSPLIYAKWALNSVHYLLDKYWDELEQLATSDEQAAFILKHEDSWKYRGWEDAPKSGPEKELLGDGPTHVVNIWKGEIQVFDGDSQIDEGIYRDFWRYYEDCERAFFLGYHGEPAWLEKFGGPPEHRQAKRSAILMRRFDWITDAQR